jgi:hypothetical protein
MATLPQKTYNPPPPPPLPHGNPNHLRGNKKESIKGTVLVIIAILVGAWGVFQVLELSGKDKDSNNKPQTDKTHKQNIVASGVSKKETPKEQIVEIASSIVPKESDIPEDERVYIFKNGKFEAKRVEEAESLGYSVIDLSDDFVPFIFTDGKKTPNSYRKTYINMANDRTDEEGKIYKNGESNYLELFGIPPSLSVIEKRFKDDTEKKCFNKLNYDFFRKARFSVVFTSRRDLTKEVAELRKRVKIVKKRSGKKSLKALYKIKKYRYLVKKYRLMNTKMAMVIEAQKRLKCEGLLKSYRPGSISWSTIKAIKKFEHKHKIFGWGILTGRTRRGFGRTPLENNFRSLKRGIRARIALSLGILEDGTVNNVKGLKGTYKGADGKEHKIPDLVGDFTAIVMKNLNIDTPEDAKEFFQALDPKIFKRFLLAVKLPDPPEYYSSDMKLSVVINRGDLWYDAPYDASGKKRYQPVMRRPRFYLYVNYLNQKIPLVRWGTTIGGWRSDFKNSKEYMAYKGSDVGPRIWKDIYAGPVWIPPKSSPPRGLVKNYRVNGKWVTKVNREEMGPSYASAYGLVAAHHIRNKTDSGKSIWFDNGIRTHGSVDYMSIMRRHSHGCHRLHNHLAVRLFSVILMRNHHSRKGQSKLIYNRGFTLKNKEYAIKLNTRGYRFSLDTAIPVMVERGRILGKLKRPYDGFLRKEGVEYDKDDPNLIDEENKKPKDSIENVLVDNKIEKSEIKKKDVLVKQIKQRKLPPLPKEKIKKSVSSLPPPPMGVNPL